MKKLFLLLLLPTLGWCDTKISALTEITSIGESDIIPVVIDPSGTPANRKIKRSNLIRTTDYIQNSVTPSVTTQKFSVATGSATTSYTTPKLIFSARNSLMVGSDGEPILSMPDIQTMYFGTDSGIAPTGGGTFNTCMGTNCMRSVTTGNFNTGYGNAALGGNILTGDQNNCIGYASCNGNTSGSFNNAMGGSALISNLTGGNNVAVGVVACRDCLTSNNTAVGSLANEFNSGGQGNTAVGYSAGVGTSTLTNSNVLGSFNTYLGYQTGQGVSSMTTISNSIAIGNGALVSASNEAQIGGRAGTGLEVNVRASSFTAESQISVTGTGAGEIVITVGNSTYTVTATSAMPAVGSFVVTSDTWSHLIAGVNLTVPGFLNIPNGTAPTVDVVGKMALDTTNGELLLHDGTAAKVVATSTHSFTVSIATAGWNGQSIVVWRAPNDMAVTINKVLMETMQAGTTVLFNLSEVNFGATASAGVDVFTVAFDSATNSGNTRIGGFANASIAATASLIFKTPTAGAAGGAPQVVTFTVYYEKTRT